MIVNEVSNTKDKYEKKFNSFQFYTNTFSSFVAGIIALIFLGEASFSPDYIFSFFGIISATVAFLYATLFDTPEKLKDCSESLKENKIMMTATILAIVGAFIASITVPFSVSSAVLVYLIIVLLSIYFVIFLDLFFSK